MKHNHMSLILSTTFVAVGLEAGEGLNILLPLMCCGELECAKHITLHTNSEPLLKHCSSDSHSSPVPQRFYLLSSDNGDGVPFQVVSHSQTLYQRFTMERESRSQTLYLTAMLGKGSGDLPISNPFCRNVMLPNNVVLPSEC